MADDKRAQDNLDPQNRSRVSQMRGQASSPKRDISKQDYKHDMSKLGKKGGKAARDDEQQRNDLNSTIDKTSLDEVL